jgi:hypothetical protein
MQEVTDMASQVDGGLAKLVAAELETAEKAYRKYQPVWPSP